jgi:hypothetical protein
VSYSPIILRKYNRYPIKKGQPKQDKQDLRYKRKKHSRHDHHVKSTLLDTANVRFIWFLLREHLWGRVVIRSQKSYRYSDDSSKITSLKRAIIRKKNQLAQIN